MAGILRYRNPLSVMLRQLACYSRYLPADKIDLIEIIRSLETPLPKRKLSDEIEAIQTWDDLERFLDDKISEAHENGQFDGFLCMIGLLEVIAAHLLFISVYLTQHIPTAIRVNRCPSPLVLMRIGFHAIEKLQYWRKLLRFHEWRSRIVVDPEIAAFFDATDKILDRALSYRKTDRKLEKFLPRARRRPGVTASLYARRWVELCADVEPWVPDLAKMKRLLDKIHSLHSRICVKVEKPGLRREQVQQSERAGGMSREEANRKAMELAEANHQFVHKTQREWAEEIGCAVGQITNLPLWIEVAARTGRARKAKQPRRVVSLTDKVLASTADPHAELERLIAEQEADSEESPLEADLPELRPKKMKARKL